MKTTGKISKIDYENGYGFVQCAGIEAVFFTKSTKIGLLSFQDLTIGMSVKLLSADSSRGRFATEMELCKSRKESLPVARPAENHSLD